MKTITRFLMLAVAIFLVGNCTMAQNEVLSTSTFYGLHYTVDLNTTSLGFNSSFITFNMQNLNSMSESDDHLTPARSDNEMNVVISAALIHDTIYYVTMTEYGYYEEEEEEDEGDSVAMSLMKIPFNNGNPQAGTSTLVKRYQVIDESAFASIAYNSNNDKLYTIFRDTLCHLCTINRSTGDLSTVANLNEPDGEGDVYLFSLTILPDGTCYALSEECELLYQVDLSNGICQFINETELFADYIHCLFSDPQSGELFLTTMNDNGISVIYKIDKETAESESVGSFSSFMPDILGGLFAAATTTTAEVSSTINFYGMDHTPTSDEEGVYIDLVNFTMQNPSQYSNICRLPSNETSVVLSCEYINDTLYYILFDVEDADNDYPAYSIYKVPFNGSQLQGSPTLVRITNTQVFESMYSMAYNPSDEKLYTIVMSYDMTTYEPTMSLCSIDRNNGTLTTILDLGDISHMMPSAIAIGQNNTVYAIIQDDRSTNSLYRFSTEGMELVGNTGVWSEGMFQGMYGDPNTGELFWVCTDETNDGISSTIYKLDLTTGQAATVGSLADNMNILTCFFLQHTTTQNEGIDNATVNVNIWPNPATEYINISSEAEITMLQLYDMSGSLVRLEGRHFGNEATLDVCNLQSGAYMLRTITSKGNSLQKIIVR